jgi:hypothetical protein
MAAWGGKKGQRWIYFPVICNTSVIRLITYYYGR